MLLDQLQSDLAAAQKARDEIKVSALRFLLGDVFNLQIAKYPPSSGGTLTDSDVQSVIKKQIKTHNESIEMFEKAGRRDLVDQEEAELKILVSYLPEQMSSEEVRRKVEEVKRDNPGADFGSLMKAAMAELSGKVDGAVVARIIKQQSGE